MSSTDLLIDRNYWSYLIGRQWTVPPSDMSKPPLPGIPGRCGATAPQGLVQLPGEQGDNGPVGATGSLLPQAELTLEVEELLMSGVVLDWEGLLCVFHQLDGSVEHVHGLPIGQRLTALLNYDSSQSPSPPGQIYLRRPDGRLEGWTLPEDHPVFQRQTVPHREYMDEQERHLAYQFD